MKSRPFLLFTLLFLSLTAVLRTVQALVLPSASPTTALMVVTAPDSAAIARLAETGLPVYARLNGRTGPLFLVAANANDRATLTATGLPHQLLDVDISGATYYLAHRLPPTQKLGLTAYGRVLLATDDVSLLRATPAQADQLAAAGLQPQAITFTPKPLPPHPAPNWPTVIQPDPLIQLMMNQVTSDTVYQYDGNLSGEWPVTIGGAPYTIASRHTNSGTPIQKATQFVGEHLTNLGLPVEYHVWNGASYPNVIGEITGQINPDEIYIFSAHLDDMPSGALAPGADDNASGSVAALIAADIFTQYQWGCTIRFAFWTGEEQGLLGSAAYAQRAYNSGENIAGVLNLDMVAWNTPNSNRDIDLHADSNLPGTLALAQLFADVVGAYNLNLVPGITPNGSGASDHASFWQYGYTAILGIEDFGDFNPYYHTPNDRLAAADLDYFTEFVQASVGTFAHMTNCLIPDGIGYLEGTVTDVSSSAPIANATIRTSNGTITTTTTTDANGYYSRTLLVGDYTVTAVAYGYLPTTLSNIPILTDTTTTQDFALTTAPTHFISGTITDLDSGTPLLAQIAFEGSPVTTLSDPVTGFYQANLAEGNYTMRVTAAGHRPSVRAIVADHDQTQDFALESLPCILLVDDDNNAPDVRAYYTAALDALAYDYDVFDVGGGSGNGPTLSELSGYEMIIWFSGDQSGGDSAGPNSTDAPNLAAYLDAGGRLFLASEDYLYDMGITSFAQTYLGIASYSEDGGNASTQYGVNGDPIGGGLGPYPLTYPSGLTDYADVVNPGAGASTSYRSAATGGNSLDIDKDGGAWKTVFFGTPWEAVANNNAANGRAVLQRIIDWFAVCDCEAAQIVTVNRTVNECTVDFDPEYTGEPPVTWDWVFGGGLPATSQLENPTVDFGVSGSYAYTATLTNCNGTCQDVYTDTVVVDCVVCTPITAVTLSLLSPEPLAMGQPVTFSLEVWPETAVGDAAPPATYTLSVDDVIVYSGTITGTPQLFTYTFSHTGPYELMATVANCGTPTPLSDTLSLSILNPSTIYLPLIRK